jgi:hypothetical protein
MQFAQFFSRKHIVRSAFSTLLMADLVVLGLVCVPDAIAEIGCAECHHDSDCDDGAGAGDLSNNGECVPISGRSACAETGSGCTSLPDGCAEYRDYTDGFCMFVNGYCYTYCDFLGGE